MNQILFLLTTPTKRLFQNLQLFTNTKRIYKEIKKFSNHKKFAFQIYFCYYIK